MCVCVRVSFCFVAQVGIYHHNTILDLDLKSPYLQNGFVLRDTVRFSQRSGGMNSVGWFREVFLMQVAEWS